MTTGMAAPWVQIMTGVVLLGLPGTVGPVHPPPETKAKHSCRNGAASRQERERAGSAAGLARPLPQGRHLWAFPCARAHPGPTRCDWRPRQWPRETGLRQEQEERKGPRRAWRVLWGLGACLLLQGAWPWPASLPSGAGNRSRERRNESDAAVRTGAEGGCGSAGRVGTHLG